MSDTIATLNEIVALCAVRGDIHFTLDEVESEKLRELLEKIVETAGECLEDHIKAAARTFPRKQRVYQEIVRRIAVHFCDVCDTPEQAFDVEESVREILLSYDIETVDYTGRKVKIV